MFYLVFFAFFMSGNKAFCQTNANNNIHSDVPSYYKVENPDRNSQAHKQDSINLNDKSTPKAEKNESSKFNIQEHRKNYFISGDPDTKVQFSFKYKLVKNFNLFLGYTQVMFWDLEEESRPFTDINFNPELFYNFQLESFFFKKGQFGYDHNSNGQAGLESRSYDSVFIKLWGLEESKIGLPKMKLTFRHLLRLDDTNIDIRRFYGPVIIKLFFNKLGRKFLRANELSLEYYTGDRFADIPNRSSFRVNLEYKIFKRKNAPKVFLQYFSGYGENLANYNMRDETIRIGISNGGL